MGHQSFTQLGSFEYVDVTNKFVIGTWGNDTSAPPKRAALLTYIQLLGLYYLVLVHILASMPVRTYRSLEKEYNTQKKVALAYKVFHYPFGDAHHPPTSHLPHSNAYRSYQDARHHKHQSKEKKTLTLWRERKRQPPGQRPKPSMR